MVELSHNSRDDQLLHTISYGLTLIFAFRSDERNLALRHRLKALFYGIPIRYGIGISFVK
ncbi:hypothetical protein GCM10007207_05940 [Asaia siamensis]|uniref:Uncharacterized protein n=1 Tax=Asaia siamensis TaxID=110479 RepID=A0ABQ1LDW7_9PROT|nr:hypothetical protein AA0323_2034 [Asaia siamensis NRIC 0323]GGC23484.1 hypothetical protein GCM10007207_05940 [Asaia siamensis]